MRENFQQVFNSIKKQGDTWEERRENILQGLNEKLETIRAFSVIVEKIQGGNIKDTKAKKLLADFKLKIEAEATPATLEKYREVEAKIARAEELSREIEQLCTERNYHVGEDKEDPEIDSKMDLRFKTYQEAMKIATSEPELNFLFQIEYAVSHLEKALRKIASYRKDNDLALRDLATIRDIDYGEVKNGLQIERVVFTPTSINFILKKGVTFKPLEQEHHEEGGYTLLGIHTRDSFVNIISGDQDNKGIDETIKHEDEHILSDALPYLTSLGPPTHAFKNPTRNRDELLKNESGRLSPANMLDKSHYEILASLAESPALVEYLKSTQNTSAEEKLLSRMFGSEKASNIPESPRHIHSTGVREILYLFHTAGIQISDMIDALKEASEGNDPEMKKFATETKTYYIQIFLRSIKSLGYAYLLADKFGNKAQKDVKLLSYLLSPSQYHHIPNFLKEKYEKKSRSRKV